MVSGPKTAVSFSEKTKVLQLYRTFFPDTQGGAEEVIRQIAINTIEFGIETRIMVPSSSIGEAKKIYVDGIAVYQVPELIEIASCNIYKGGFQLLTELIEWADIIHYHYHYHWPFQDVLHFMLVKRARKKRLLHTIRTSFASRLYLSYTGL
jgi:hypothetical protein